MKRKNKVSFGFVNEKIGKEKYSIITLSILELFFSVLSISTAIFLKEIVDSISNSDDSRFYTFLLILLIVTVLSILLKGLERYLTEFHRTKIENILKRDYFSRYLDNRFMDMESIHSQDIITRLTSDCQFIASSYLEMIPSFLGVSIRLVLIVVLLIVFNPRLSLFLIPIGTVLFLLSFILRKKMKDRQKRVQETESSLRMGYSDTISSLMIVKAYEMEDERKNFENELLDENRKARISRNNLYNFFGMGFSFVVKFIYVLSIFLLGKGLLSLTITYGSFIGTLDLISQISNPFVQLSGFIPRYYSMISLIERLREIEDFEKEEKVNSKSINDFDSIELKNVSFGYSEKCVLKGFDMEIRRGECIGLIGESGSGKTTILKLLLSLYDVNSGNIYIERNGIKEELTKANRNLFAYVPQTSLLINGTILSAITGSDLEYDDIKLNEALEISCSKEFIDEFPDGINHLIHENQSGLSVGQLTRINIARAIYSSRPILLLDEVTSALDEKCEMKLINNLKSLNDKTIILITHRKETLSISDRIVEVKRRI